MLSMSFSQSVDCAKKSIYNKGQNSVSFCLRKDTCNRSEVPVMSYVHAIIVNNRIVFASDSRNTVIEKEGNTYFSDGFKKICFLEDAQIGIVTSGNNQINGVCITDWLEKLQIPSSVSVEEKLYKISCRLQEYIQPGGVINIAAGGFENGVAKLCYVDIIYGREAIVKTSDFFWKVNGTAWKLFLDEDGFLDIFLPDTKSVLDFSDFLVETEIGMAKYKKKFPSIGGPVQTLLLENGKAKWIHQLY